MVDHGLVQGACKLVDIQRSNAKSRGLQKDTPNDQERAWNKGSNRNQQSTKIGAKNQHKLFLDKVFREPFGLWTSMSKIVDVRPKKCVFLRPR